MFHKVIQFVATTNKLYSVQIRHVYDPKGNSEDKDTEAVIRARRQEKKTIFNNYRIFQSKNWNKNTWRHTLYYLLRATLQQQEREDTIQPKPITNQCESRLRYTWEQNVTNTSNKNALQPRNSDKKNRIPT